MNGQQNELEKLNLTGFLVGHYGSKKILQASSYLNRKYIPEEINLRYLNFEIIKLPIFMDMIFKVLDILVHLRNTGQQIYVKF